MAHPLGGDLVDFAIVPGDGADDGRSTGQVRNVSGELSRPMHRDCFRRLPGFIEDLDLAGLDDEELEVAVADLEEFFAVPVALELRFRTARQGGDLVRVERRECDGVQIGLSHGSKSLQDKIGVLK